MAYGKRLYMDFDDFLGTTWTVEIWHNLFDEAAIEMECMGSPPVSIRYVGEKEKVIIGSEATLKILITDAMSWILTSKGNDIKVIIKKSGSVFWTGFALAGEYIDEFTDEERFLIMVANDHIGMLDSVLYQSMDIQPQRYTGYETAIVQLARALNHTGLNLSIITYDNLFESTMSMDDSDDPYLQFSINQDLWLDEYQNPGNCKTVIQKILEVRDCRIFQSGGKWVIQHKWELSNPNIDYRAFDYLGVCQGHGSSDLRLTSESDMQLMADCSIEYLDGWKSRTINIDYGLKPSLIAGHWFEDGVSDLSDPTSIEGWENTGGWMREIFEGVGYMWVTTLPNLDKDQSKYIQSPKVSVSGSLNHKISMNCGRDHRQVLIPPVCVIDILWHSDADPSTIYHWYEVGQSWIVTDADITDPGFPRQTKIDFPKVSGPGSLVTQELLIGPTGAPGKLYIKILTPWRGFGSFSNSNFYFTGIKIERVGIDPVTEEELGIVAGSSYEWQIEEEEFLSFEPLNAVISDGLPDRTLVDYYNGWIKIGDSVTSGLWNLKEPAYDSLPLVVMGIGDSNIFGWLCAGWYVQYSSHVKKLKGTLYGLGEYANTLIVNELDSTQFIFGDVEYEIQSGEWYGNFIELKEPINPGLKTGVGRIKSLLWKNQNEITKTISTGLSSISFFDEFRSGTESIVAGQTLIAFSTAFSSGLVYQLFIKVINSSGEGIGCEITTQNESGFTVNSIDSGILTYFAIKGQ